MKLIFKLLRKIIISSFLLYGYNLLVQPLNLMIPINVITVSAITILGIPGLLAMVLILVYVY